MHALRKVTWLFLLACVTVSQAQKPVQEWLPVTAEDKQIQDTPWKQGASAIQLYFDYYKDDNENLVSVYKRIKIFKDAGKKYADVEIELKPGTTLKQLAARTIHPDGTIVDFHGKPFDKTLFKARGFSYQAATFTFPDVTLGSILEYRYVIGLPPYVVDQISVWPIQDELFTLHENLRFRAFQGLVRVPTEGRKGSSRTQVSYTYLNQLDPTPPEHKKNVMQLELNNVAPFEREDYMPPEADFKPAVFFYYGGRETASPETFWDEWAKIESAYKEKFLGGYREVKERAVQVVGNESDPERELRKLYAAAQQIRNLSFERSRTQIESKQENLNPNRTVAEVLAHRYGSSSDINHLFVAMARASGFEADVVQVSNRSLLSFNKLLLSLAQLEDTLAAVKLNGRDIFLDPGTEYCPFGLLRWQNTSVQAVRFSRTGAAFVTTPDPQSASTHRAAKVSIGADGTLEGEISYEINGQEALIKRLEGIGTDEAGRRKSFEDQVRSSLPTGASVVLKELSGWQSADQPIMAKFAITIPNFASTAGKRLIGPSLLFRTQQQLFEREVRRYPIMFPYPFQESDEVTIRFPEDYSVEAPPYNRKAGLSYAGYELSSTVNGHELSTRRSLHFDGFKFEPESYSVIKGFFDVVGKGDAGQVVLEAKQNAGAGSSE